MTTYTIKQNAHYASPRCIFCLPKTLTELSYNVSFFTSCFYNPTVLGSDASDINKLFGFSYGLTNSDSLRVGWRSIGNNQIEIIAYLHVNGKRYTEAGKRYASKLKVVPNATYSMSLKVIGTSFEMRIVDPSTNTIDTITGNYPHGGIRLGWEMGIYFGGNKTAPNTMLINFS